MITQQTYALLALTVYQASAENTLDLPDPWIQTPQPTGTDGFAYAVYKNPSTNEVVISYRGTDNDVGDWTTNLGISTSQEKQAAAVYARVLHDYGIDAQGSNITFTGHSLGGGLAGTMAVWFNRPAVVFDPAPSEVGAKYLLDVADVIGSLGANAPQSINDYVANITTQFAVRESNVTSYFIPGSIVHSISTAGNTITGGGQDNPVQFGATNMLGIEASKELHSQALLTAGLLSPSFASATVAVQRALPLIMDKKLYALPMSGSERNFLVDGIRSELGSGDKLTHFAADLNKLGTNIAGLNAKAQDAIIAQGIEWYYWQGNNCAGQQFFADTGPQTGLLQYTTAQGDGLEGAKNKALTYLNSWLTPIYNAHGEFGGRVDFAEWSVATGSDAVTATARDADKTQMFIGGAGADTFTGGKAVDTILAGAGADTLNGGEGGDWLYGGEGNDTYLFDGAFGSDTISDTDGVGVIKIDGTQLSGGQKLSDNLWESGDGKYRYTVMGGNLIVSRGSNAGAGDMRGGITIKSWSAGQLGITLDDTQKTTPTNRTYLGDQAAPLDASGYYNWAATTWLADGALQGGTAAANFDDVIYAGATDDKMFGLGGNDALNGGAGNDQIEGGSGDDLIGGGAGADTILGGTGNDVIWSAADLTVGQRSTPTDSWSLPSGGILISKGSTWGVYTNANNEWVLNWTNFGPQDSAGDIVDAGDGDDFVMGGSGQDYIVGGLGQDGLEGWGGDDVIEGGQGNDIIDGDDGWVQTAGVYHFPDSEAGNDYIDGGDGNDQIRGQGGDDDLYGGTGNDQIWGDDIHVGPTGNDYIDGEAGADALIGGGKDDTLFGGTEDDVLLGDDGQNNLTASEHGNDYLDGEDGNDLLIGGGKDDTLFGGLGNDRLLGDDVDSTVGLAGADHGNDYLDGEEGDDVLIGGGKDDTLMGSAGTDVLYGDDITANLAGDFHGNDYLDGGDGNDTLFGNGGADTLYGGAGDDELQGDANANDLAGKFHGNDYLDGGAGNDRLFGQGGNDTLLGGAGDDILKGDGTTTNVPGTYQGDDYLDGGDGNDTLEGGGGADLLYGGAGNDILQGDALTSDVAATYHGNDQLYGGDGYDKLYGGGGDDVLYGEAGIDELSGDDGNDTLSGGAEGDYLYGGAGNDTLYGEDGNDYLYGNAGDDTLFGGAGNDYLMAGTSGNDTLDGGAGQDGLAVGDSGKTTVLFGRGDGQDTLSWAGRGATTVVQFKLGVTAADLSVYRNNNGALVVNITGTSDVLVLPGYPTDAGAQSQSTGLPVFKLADGSAWAPGGTTRVFQYGTNDPNNKQMNGTDGSDLLLATADGNYIYAGMGDDYLYGSQETPSALPPDGGGFTYFNSTFDGGDGNDRIVSGAGKDALYGGSGDDYLDGGAGNDSLNGGSGANTYVFEVGGGNDLITAGREALSTDFQTLKLTGINSTDITLWRRNGINADKLEIQIIGTSDTITIDEYFVPESAANMFQPIDQIQFADGTIWNRSQIIANLHAQPGVVVTGTDTYGENLYGGTGDDQLYGLGGGDWLYGGSGNDLLVGGLGDDNYFVQDVGDSIVELAGEGTDYVNASVSYTLADNVENLTLLDSIYGSEPLNGYGNSLDNRLEGNSADNFLDGGLGADTMAGGMGNDTYIVDNAGDIVQESADSGIDTVISAVTWTLGADVENLRLSGTASINATGNSLSNVLIGNAGNNLLNGGAGADSMSGGAGNDTYTVDNAADVVLENANEGTDLVNASASFTLSDNVENLTLTGTAAINGTGTSGNNVLMGNSAANVLSGGAGDDTLDGKAGADTLIGGSGNDSYVVDNTADAITELLNEGTDSVSASVTYTLSTNIENLTLTGTSAINGTGNNLDNVLTGNSGANVLTGGAGNDTYVVGTGDSVIEAVGGGTDTVLSSVTWTLGTEVENLTLTGTSAISGTGNALNNVIMGNAGNNTLDGATGSDTMSGGAGNDTYLVDNIGDIVIENANEGTDLVQSSIGYTLTANVENLTLTGTAAINGTGNALNNTITGNSGNNVLNGGVGADTMVGGAGNDTYYVDNAADVTTEAASAGADLVVASLSWTLGANLENLTLTGTSAINGTGNTLANTIIGNSADNVLDGGTGTDTLIGGAGNDTYILDVATDVVTENTNEGTDTVKTGVTYTLGANVENLTLTGTSAVNGTGNTLDNVLIGNSAVNTLTGGAGNDTLDGAAGADKLLGGLGDDTYVVDNTGDVITENASEGIDLVQSSVTFTLSTNVENLTLTGSAATNATGNTGDNVLIGNSAINTLTGGAGNDTLDGGAGADSLIGGTGNDIYWLGRGYGVDSITENDATAGNTDVAKFDATVSNDQLWFVKNGNNLEVSIIGTSDKFTVTNWYLGSQYHVEQFKTGNGKTLLDSQVQNLVNAMASFSPPVAGQTTLPASYASGLNTVIAANWQ